MRGLRECGCQRESRAAGRQLIQLLRPDQDCRARIRRARWAWERAKRVFNILADRVETVAPWLAQKVLDNEKNGARFTWLPRHKVLGRFLSAPLRKRDLFN